MVQRRAVHKRQSRRSPHWRLARWSSRPSCSSSSSWKASRRRPSSASSSLAGRCRARIACNASTHLLMALQEQHAHDLHGLCLQSDLCQVLNSEGTPECLCVSWKTDSPTKTQS